MNVTPYEITKPNKIWILKIVCPSCKKNVRHGGGDEAEPTGGSRACNTCNASILINC